MAPVCMWGSLDSHQLAMLVRWVTPPPGAKAPCSPGIGQGTDSFPQCPQKAKVGKKACVNVSTVLSLVPSPTRQRVQQKLRCREITTGMQK